MKIDDIIKQLEELNENPNYVLIGMEPALTAAIRLLSESRDTGYITPDARVQRYPEQAQFRTKDGAIVKPGQLVFAGERALRYGIYVDGTVAYWGTELVDGHIYGRYLRADECYSTKAAALAAKGNG